MTPCFNGTQNAMRFEPNHAILAIGLNSFHCFPCA